MVLMAGSMAVVCACGHGKAGHIHVKNGWITKACGYAFCGCEKFKEVKK